MTSDIVSVEIGRSTWQGPAEEAPRRASLEQHPHWAVTVETSGEQIVRIETECYGGRELSAADEEAVRTAAHHLLAFIGDCSADMAECFAFSAGYEAGERDGCASGQQVRAVEMLGELLAYEEWQAHVGGVVPDRFLGVINRAIEAYRAALTPAPQPEGLAEPYATLLREVKARADLDREQGLDQRMGLSVPQPEGQVRALKRLPQYTLCEDCGKEILHDEAGWSTDGSSYCRACRTLTPAPDAAHSDDQAVDRFAAAMKVKLAKKRAEGSGGWDRKDECSAEDLSYMLVRHLWKGDPLDVGNLAMMLHQRGERIVLDGEGKSIAPQPEGMVRAMWPRWRAMLLDESPIPGAAIKEMDAAFAALSSGEGRDDE